MIYFEELQEFQEKDRSKPTSLTWYLIKDCYQEIRRNPIPLWVILSHKLEQFTTNGFKRDNTSMKDAAWFGRPKTATFKVVCREPKNKVGWNSWGFVHFKRRNISHPSRPGHDPWESYTNDGCRNFSRLAKANLCSVRFKWVYKVITPRSRLIPKFYYNEQDLVSSLYTESKTTIDAVLRKKRISSEEGKDDPQRRKMYSKEER